APSLCRSVANLTLVTTRSRQTRGPYEFTMDLDRLTTSSRGGDPHAQHRPQDRPLPRPGGSRRVSRRRDRRLLPPVTKRHGPPVGNPSGGPSQPEEQRLATTAVRNRSSPLRYS